MIFSNFITSKQHDSICINFLRNFLSYLVKDYFTAKNTYNYFVNKVFKNSIYFIFFIFDRINFRTYHLY